MGSVGLGGDLTISMQVKNCKNTNLVKCIDSVKIDYVENDVTTILELASDDDVKINNDYVKLPTSVNDIIVTATTSLFVKIKGKDFEVLFDQNGRLYITLSSGYATKVCTYISHSFLSHLFSPRKAKKYKHIKYTERIFI